MQTRVLEGVPADLPESLRGVAWVAPPARSWRWMLMPAIGLAILAVLTVAGNTNYMVFGLGLFAAGVVLSNLAPEPTLDPIELSLTVFLALVIAVPFGKLPHERTTSIVSVLSLLAIGLSGLARASHQPPRGRVLAVALFVLLIPASIYGPDSGAIKRLIIIAVAALPGFFLGGQLDNRRLRAISSVLLALALAEALIAIAEPFVFPGHLWIPAPLDATGNPKPLLNPFHSAWERSQATLGHPLALGLLLVIALALLVRVLDTMNRWTRLLAGGVLGLGLIFSGDRSCLLAALLILIAGARLRSVRVWISLGVGSATVLSALVVNAVGSSVLTNFASSGSYLHRASAYSLVWRLFSTQSGIAAFGGNGFGSTQRLFDKGLLQTDGFNVVDNQFVLIQAQGGVICLLLLLVISGMAICVARRELRPAVIFAVGVSVLFDWLSWTSDSALIFMLLGAALANVKPSMAANRLVLESNSALVPHAREASLQR